MANLSLNETQKFEISLNDKQTLEISKKSPLFSAQLLIEQNDFAHPNSQQIQNHESFPERKIKLKPDQLPIVKILILINFFGITIIMNNLMFVYMRLIWLFKNSDFDYHFIVIISICEFLSDIIFVTSWISYFISSLKRKLQLLKITCFVVILSTGLKVVSFLIWVLKLDEILGNVGMIEGSSLFISFQFFSIWNYRYVYIKMRCMPEKNWKKAFRRPKGKYMYAQE